MTDQLKRFMVLMLIICTQTVALYSEDHISRDNYTGNWESPSSWSPEWSDPQVDINEYNVTVYGYLTLNNSLMFSTDSGKIIIRDTLVITGDLQMKDKTNLIIGDSGILVIKGDLYVDKHVDVLADGYLVIMGDIYKGGPRSEGSLTSNDDPVKVFVGGSIPWVLTDGNHQYPALNCGDSLTATYGNSGCSYGNFIDLVNDPVDDFIQSLCTPLNPVISANGPLTFCQGDSLGLIAEPGLAYLWSDGDTSGNRQVFNSGEYRVRILDNEGCLSNFSNTISVTVFDTPDAEITPAGPLSLCAGDSVTLTTMNGTSYKWSTGASSRSIDVTGSGVYNVDVFNENGCMGHASVEVTFYEVPEAIAGPDQEMKFIFQAELTAELPAGEEGTWQLVSGKGDIKDIHSPITEVSGLGIGDNIFQWKTWNENCADSTQLTITVLDLFIPSVITPDGDGKNDVFRIGDLRGSVELEVFNRWGLKVYGDNNYHDNWNGVDQDGNALSEDTYFYILNFGKGVIKKGSLLIKR